MEIAGANCKLLERLFYTSSIVFSDFMRVILCLIFSLQFVTGRNGFERRTGLTRLNDDRPNITIRWGIHTKYPFNREESDTEADEKEEELLGAVRARSMAAITEADCGLGSSSEEEEDDVNHEEVNNEEEEHEEEEVDLRPMYYYQHPSYAPSNVGVGSHGMVRLNAPCPPKKLFIQW